MELKNIGAEQSILGAIILDNKKYALVRSILDTECFSSVPHQGIFKAIKDLMAREHPVDMNTLQEELDIEDKLKSIGGVAYIADLVDSVSALDNTEYHCEIVLKKFLSRTLLDALNKTAEDVSQGHEINEVMMRTIDKMNSIMETQPLKKYSLDETLEDLMNFISSEKARLFSGYDKLDKKIGGFQSGFPHIIAGSPGSGKTTFITNLILRFLDEKKKVLFFSCEMTKAQILLKAVSNIAGVSEFKARMGNLTKEEKGLCEETGEEFKERTKDLFYLFDDVYKVDNMCRYIDKIKPDIVFVDYIQIMSMSREWLRIEILETLKALSRRAKKFSIPIIVASQLNREWEKRPNKRPQLSDLKESSYLEDTAGNVLFLVRPYTYTDNEDDREKLFIYIGKAKFGELGKIRLHYDTSINRITSQ